MREQRTVKSSGWGARALRWALVSLVASAGAALAAEAAHATIDVKWIEKGKVVSAPSLSAALSDAEKRLVALEKVRTESAVLDAECALVSSSSAWLVPSKIAAGECAIAFNTGTFSGPPTCIGQSYGSNGAWPKYSYVVRINGPGGLGLPTAAGIRARHQYVDTQPPSAALFGAADAQPFGIICTGPR